jgi:hypothetical protein
MIAERLMLHAPREDSDEVSELGCRMGEASGGTHHALPATDDGLRQRLHPSYPAEAALPTKRRYPPPQFAGKVRELGDVMSSVPTADWGIEE